MSLLRPCTRAVDLPSTSRDDKSGMLQQRSGWVSVCRQSPCNDFSQVGRIYGTAGSLWNLLIVLVFQREALGFGNTVVSFSLDPLRFFAAFYCPLLSSLQGKDADRHLFGLQRVLAAGGCGRIVPSVTFVRCCCVAASASVHPDGHEA